MICIMCVLLQGTNTGNEVELKVLLPDRTIVTVTIKRNYTTEKVYHVSIHSPASLLWDVVHATSKNRSIWNLTLSP